MPYCLYLATEEVLQGGPGGGSGTIRRNRLMAYGIASQDWDFAGAKPWRIALTADTTDAILDTADADSLLRPLSPRFTTLTLLEAWLDQPFSESDPLFTVIEQQLGVGLGWHVSTTTRREALKYIAQMMRIIGEFYQRILRAREQSEANPDQFFVLFMRSLSVQLRDIPAAQRNRIQTWLQSKGFDLSNLQGTDTVRQALHQLVLQFNPRGARLGPVNCE